MSTARGRSTPEVFLPVLFEAEDRAVRETIRLAQSENRARTIAIPASASGERRSPSQRRIGGRVLEPKKPDMTSPGVIASTIHNVKGLEFDTVIVKGVTDGILPMHDLRRDGRSAGGALMGDCARRVLYVAMTRAKRRLVLIAGRPSSPLIDELDPRLYRRVDY